MNFLDFFGYLSSVIILISLTMSSIIKLRVINTFGSLLFTIYGFIVGSIPTAFLNLGIVVINIYYLYKILKKKNKFKLIETTSESESFKHFYELNNKELKEIFGTFSINKEDKIFFMTRNHNTAGILIGEMEKELLKIKVDYVIKEYRDFKLGNYFFNENTSDLTVKGIKKVYCESLNSKHKEYLEQIGFEKVNNNLFEKIL